MREESVVSARVAGGDGAPPWIEFERAVCDGWFNRDAEALHTLASGIPRDGTPWSRYYLALALFFAAQLAGKGSTQAMSLLEQARQELESMDTTDVHVSTERRILLGAIYGMLAACASFFKRARPGMQSMTELRLAYESSPDNPRAVFAYASACCVMARVGSRDWQDAVDLLHRSELLFNRPMPPQAFPRWGHLHALLYVGELHLRKGEIVLAQQVSLRMQRLTRGLRHAAIDDFSRRAASA